MKRTFLLAIVLVLSGVGLLVLDSREFLGEAIDRTLAPGGEAQEAADLPGAGLEPASTVNEGAGERMIAMVGATMGAAPWTRARAQAAIQRGEEPRGFGRLDIEARRAGIGVADISVNLRGTADSIHAPRSSNHWSYFVRSGSHVLVDVTDEASGWVQTETTLAPDSEEARTLVVELDPPEIHGEVLLRLVSSADGSPITEAQVISVSDDPPDFQEGATDASGRAPVPSGPSFRYVITAPGFAGLELPAFEPTARAFQTYELKPVARLYGSVNSDLEGEGSIEVTESEVDPNHPDGVRRRTITSAEIRAGGTWATGDIVVPEGREALTGVGVDLVADGIRRSLARGLTVAPGARLEVLDPVARFGSVTIEAAYPSGRALGKGLRIALRRTVAGRDAGGAPMEGPMESHEESLEGTLDQDGRIRFASLAPGTWSVRVDREEAIEVEISGDPIQTIVLTDRTMLAGHIARRDEVPDLLYPPFLSHFVSVKIAQGEGFTLLKTQCDPDGRFRFDLLPAGIEVELGVESARGAVEWTGLVAETGSTGLILEFVGHPKTQTLFDSNGSFESGTIRRARTVK